MNALPQVSTVPPSSSQEIVELIKVNSNRDEKITQQILEKLFYDQNSEIADPLTQDQKKTMPIMGNCDKCIYVVDEKGEVHFLKAFVK